MRKLTPNQVVAHNLRRARMLHGLTQEAAAAKLEPYLGERWSQVVFSAAERSITGERIRQFTADDLVAFAQAFEVPVPFFLAAPRDAELVAAPGASEGVIPSELADLANWTDEARARVTRIYEQTLAEYGRRTGMEVVFEEPEGARVSHPAGDKEEGES
jgi:transcriptional regulator with XRE-family HTH domain